MTGTNGLIGLESPSDKIPVRDLVAAVSNILQGLHRLQTGLTLG